ncbi:GntR family transcriptional regulator [Kitasatospora sp. NPDC059803]|uniref:GntR family transcriptional regulator n=1 Tax=Kitasatospora sp. NPDC059803 TaxID=3346953 RepID=UPI00364AF510
MVRGTVDKALDLLRTEGLIGTRQGSGSFVRERTSRPVGLRPHLEAAFEQQQVTLDFAGFSSETLHNALQEPLDKVRSGRLAPESITVRLLLPDTTAPMAVPVLVDGLQDEAVLRQRARNIALTNAGGIEHSVEMLAELGLVQKASVQVKVHRASSLFKLYILNRSEALFGFYPLRERTVAIDDTAHTFYDVTGKDTTLFHHAAGPDDASLGSQYVQQPRCGSTACGARSPTSGSHDRHPSATRRRAAAGEACAPRLRRPGVLGLRRSSGPRGRAPTP